MSKTGVLLINLGTPDKPETAEVRRYLAEFLSDPRVIDLNPVSRWLLLHLVILRTRPSKSAQAYRKVWDPERGSPLLYHSRDLTAAVARALGEGAHVVLGMRYGKPSLGDALGELERVGVTRLVVMPMYPQYASSSTGSSLEKLFALLGRGVNVPAIEVVPPFFDQAAFIAAFAARGRPVLDTARPDHVLMSFHGLPERQIRASDPSGAHCLTNGCCDRMVEHNRFCYRAQCYATARALTAALGIAEDAYRVTFQSRLGRTPWIQPHTDVVIDELARAGKKRLVVFCPAFVADCLETLEEIALRAREQFRAAGGEELTLVPSLNAAPEWVSAVADLLRPRL